jgi:4-oxalocrotonate tautomerase
MAVPRKQGGHFRLYGRPQGEPGAIMPHIVVKMFSGQSDETKQALADSLAEAMMKTLGSPPHSISVGIEDVPQPEWMANVYEPEIAGRSDTLFRKPGYGSLAQ